MDFSHNSFRSWFESTLTTDAHRRFVYFHIFMIDFNRRKSSYFDSFYDMLRTFVFLCQKNGCKL